MFHIIHKHKKCILVVYCVFCNISSSFCSSWSQAIEICADENEKAWIYHEMGKSFYELDNFDDAKDFGEMSLDSAVKADKHDLQTNAYILIARVLGKACCSSYLSFNILA